MKSTFVRYRFLGYWWIIHTRLAFRSPMSAYPRVRGALLLFGAVQATMIGYGLWVGEPLRMRPAVGFTFALGGLVGLLLPGLSAPSLLGCGLMLGAGDEVTVSLVDRGDSYIDDDRYWTGDELVGWVWAWFMEAHNLSHLAPAELESRLRHLLA